MAKHVFFWAKTLTEELINDVVEAWHDHRVAIILLAASVLLLLRVYLHLTGDREGLRVFPKIYNNEVVEEKQEKKSKDALPSECKAKAERDAVPTTQKRSANGPRRIKGENVRLGRRKDESGSDAIVSIQLLLFFSSLAGTTERIANDYASVLSSALSAEDDRGMNKKGRLLAPRVLNLADVDYEDYFTSPPKTLDGDGKILRFFYLLMIPSYNIDTINDTFLEHLKETHHDFRIDTAPLSTILGYSVFGLGDRDGWPTEKAGFCFQAKEADKWMAKLSGRRRAFPVGMGDFKTDVTQRLEEWHAGMMEVLRQFVETGSLGERVQGSGAAVESDESEVEEGVDKDDAEVMLAEPVAKKPALREQTESLQDVEDIGRMVETSAEGQSVTNRKTGVPIAVDFTTYDKGAAPKIGTPATTTKEMVPKDSPTHQSLTKQGYSIVGSHSGVKICRWTKSALRGRGSCYKFSFYGISSHQCMETTPSLSCSNKCVFCWRHGTNPVGTSWRWVVDPPGLILKGVKANHYNKIKMMRGVPGVRAERFAEAMRIRHCALSLVGEPIFYPHINGFLSMLHAERISSFLVCNAQHPDQLAALQHVTQLYVSIDASNRESLRRIDRPLHRDFWERFQRCLDILRERRFRQRTVFRLTLVKGFNVENEADGYAALVGQGLPCFVEIKGVTYCGTSAAGGAGLSMANVPFYHEVCDFVTTLERKLRERGLKYGIAAEHAHSCCVLLASERFRLDGKWHTLIDYDRFFDLLEEKGPDGDFTPEDYMGPETPEWATWGRGGFDPRDQRVDRKGRPVVQEL